MKRTFFIIILSYFVSCIYSQVSFIGQAQEVKKEETIILYDSLSNIKTSKVVSDEDIDFYGHLIGQILIYCNTDLPNGKDYDLKQEMTRTVGDNEYKYYDYAPAPEVGTEFSVIDVMPKRTNRRMNQKIILKNSETGNLFQYTPGFDTNAKWVVKGFYEKMKQLHVGKQFYYIEGAIFSNDKDFILDLQTNEKVNAIKNESKWTCTDISIKITQKGDYSLVGDYRSRVVLIIENEQSQKFYCYLQNEYGYPIKNEFTSNETKGTNLFLGKFLDKEQFEKFNINLKERKLLLTKKYGAGNADAILKGVVKLGMTRDMCIESWGEPEKRNTTKGSYGVHEQWVYYSQYLYFENGILTAIQDN